MTRKQRFILDSGRDRKGYKRDQVYGQDHELERRWELQDFSEAVFSVHVHIEVTCYNKLRKRKDHLRSSVQSVCWLCNWEIPGSPLHSGLHV